MKIDISKILPWVVALSMFSTTVYVYAQTITSQEERTKTLISQLKKAENTIEKEKDKQDRRYRELIDLFGNLNIKLTKVLTLLGDK